MDLHYDYNQLSRWDKTPAGFLRIWGTIARTGWLAYQNADGTTRWEYVSPEVLFSQEHLDSIYGAALTLTHPKDPVTPNNWRQFAVGSTGTEVSPNPDEGTLDIITVVCDADAIESVLSGKTRQLSMGYQAELKKRADGKFDQISRICNHNALVEMARAGPTASLHLDGWQQVDQEKEVIEIINKDAIIMPNFNCDGNLIDIPVESQFVVSNALSRKDGQISNLKKTLGKIKGVPASRIDADDPDDDDDAPWVIDDDMEYDSVPEMVKAFKKQTKDFKAMKAEMDKKDSRCDSLSGEIEGLKIQLAARNDSGTNEALKTRLKLHNEAVKHLPRNFNADSLHDLTDRQLKETVILTKDPSLKDVLSNHNDAFVDGIYLGITRNDSQRSPNDSLQYALNGIQSVPNNTNNQRIDKFNFDMDAPPAVDYLVEIGNRYKSPNK